jgi:Tfp pilus assembly protein PilN
MPAHKNKNINLIIKLGQPTSFSEQFLSWALTYGRYIIIITQIVVLSVFFARFKLDRDHTDLKETVLQKQALIESISDLEKDIVKTQKKLGNIRQLTKNQDKYIVLIQFLQENIPSDTSFSFLSIRPDKIQFSATTDTLRSFGYLIKKFQQENRFSEATLDDISRKSDGKIEFKINAKVSS